MYFNVSKIIRTRIEVQDFHPFLNYGKYRDIRKRLNLSCETKCFKCGRNFHPEDKTFLAITNKGNKLFCEHCYTECNKILQEK